MGELPEEVEKKEVDALIEEGCSGFGFQMRETGHSPQDTYYDAQ